MKTSDWLICLRNDSRPRELIIEISTYCNYACIHCFRYGAKDFKQCFMSKDLFTKIINEAERVSVRRIIFSGWGEPTTHPSFMEFYRETKSRGFEVVLNTNGYRLATYSEELVKTELDELYVSIDAIDVELYSRIRRLGDLTIVSKGLLAVREAKKRLGFMKPIVKAIFTVNKLNVREIPKIVSYAKDMGISEVILSYYIPYQGGRLDIDCLGETDCREIFREKLREVALKSLETGVKITKPNINPSTTRSCPFAFNRALFIRCDGKVNPCIYYSRTWETKILGIKRRIREVVIGNVLSDDLMDLWRKNASLFFKLYFLSLPSCLDCELQDFCHLTMSNDSDCWGNQPSCAHCPYLHELSYCPV